MMVHVLLRCLIHSRFVVSEFLIRVRDSIQHALDTTVTLVCCKINIMIKIHGTQILKLTIFINEIPTNNKRYR